MKKSFSTTSMLAAMLILLFAFSFTLTSSGQSAREEANKLQRPKDCGVTDYDSFKNASFNLLGEVKKTDLNYAKVKTDIDGYLTGGKEATVDGVKSDINRMKAILKSIEDMDDRVKRLTEEGNDLLQNAKDVKPVTKVKAATSNTKDSIKAVDVSKDLMKELTETATGDLDKLVEKVTELGGSVDDEG
jgi:hypothetical protein